MKNKIDTKEAPEGYHARLSIDGCIGCHFDVPESTDCDNTRKCCPYERKDECGVVFIKGDCPEDQVKRLKTSLKETLSCLENWVEIADKEDQRKYDHDAIKKAKALLAELDKENS